MPGKRKHHCQCFIKVTNIAVFHYQSTRGYLEEECPQREANSILRSVYPQEEKFQRYTVWGEKLNLLGELYNSISKQSHLHKHPSPRWIGFHFHEEVQFLQEWKYGLEINSENRAVFTGGDMILRLSGHLEQKSQLIQHRLLLLTLLLFLLELHFVTWSFV